MSKRALILGIGGQDGSHQADLLLERGYSVHGLYRHSSADNLFRLTPQVRKQITLHRGDVTDYDSVYNVINAGAPQEVYNVADQDNVGWSKTQPVAQMEV